ncbi:MAG: rhamnogalacturonan acetylesterase [Prolixibacteraceae bacterium]
MKQNTKLFIVFIILLSFSCAQEKETTIFLVGDSTMADKPYVAGNPEKGWGQIFPIYFNAGIRVDNHALNGRSSRSFRDEGRWAVVLDKMVSGDYVLIEFGHNDQKIKDSTRYSDPDTAYRQNLIRYVEEVSQKGGIPVLATPIVRRRFDENGVFYDTHGIYPEVVREVAAFKNVPLLDLHLLSQELLISYGEEASKKLFLHINSGEYESLPNGREDDTHLSAVGASRICDLVKSELILKIPELAEKLKK